MMMTFGLPRLQKQVHHRPNSLPMHLHMTTKTLEVQECIKELGRFLKASSRKKQLQNGTKVQGMKMALMVIVLLVLTLVIRLWIVDSTEEEAMEVSMPKLDAGHVTKMDILPLLVTH